MNKSNEISKELKSLELKAGNLFSDLLKHGEFDFLQNEIDEGEEYSLDLERIDILNEGLLPMIEMRNDITGNCMNVYIESVDENGITCSTIDEYEQKKIKFSDLGSLEDRLVLLNEMEELLKKVESHE